MNSTSTLALTLYDRGLVSLPLPGLMLAEHRQEFMATMRDFPEFRPGHEPSSGFVMGGFSALGNSASFHNPLVRRLRSELHALVRPLMTELSRLEGHEFKLEQLIDRMMYRPRGKVPSAETWHKDISPAAHSTDLIFGGWLNLDDQPQVFSCIQRTHRIVDPLLVPENTGFAKLSKDQSKALANHPDALAYSVPPGSLLIFYERLTHEVRATKLQTDSYRMFTGWRLTCSDQPLYNNLNTVLEEQSVPFLKSGQLPPMYAKLHLVNWIDQLSEWSNGVAVVPECTEQYTPRSGKRKGEEFTIVRRVMPSLKRARLPMYRAYTEEERALLHPSSLFFP